MSFMFLSKRKEGDYDIPLYSVILYPNSNVPSGYTAYTALDNMYVMSGNTNGTSVLGNATHTHSVSATVGYAGNHTHPITISSSVSQTRNLYCGYGTVSACAAHTHATTSTSAPDGNHTHSAGNTTNAVANCPNYIRLWWIQKTSSDAKLPIGAILMWYGSAMTLPSNFILCNGQNGTPNVKGKFIRNSTEQVVHSHSHSLLNLLSSGNHTHNGTYSSGVYTAGVSGFQQASSYGSPSHSHNIPHTTNSVGAHTHSSIESNVSNCYPNALHMYFVQYKGD